MDNKPSIDRTFFVPIIIGFLSVLGICLVLAASRLGAARGNVQSGDTATPLKYQYIGTEPGVVLPAELPSPAELAETITPTSAPTIVLVLPTTTSLVTKPATRLTPIVTFVTTDVSTSVSNPVSTNTPTPTISPTAQFLNVTYDDTDFKFLYTGTWVAQNNVTGTYQNTLHISNAIGDAVQLSFVGQQIRFTFQAGPSLGVVAIKLDGVDFALDQSSPNSVTSVWESPLLVLSSHSITITHISGGSVNIDAIAVLDASTPTATATRTTSP
ncbi:MAG: hypothetical protein ABI986_02205 [Chloroflexota bacterium]